VHSGSGHHSTHFAIDLTDALTASTQIILVDQTILVQILNENETLHKLVIKLQPSNAQLQSQ